MAVIVVVFVLAVVGALIGTRLAEVPKISGRVLAVSGALLIGISLIWVLPEVAARNGWRVAAFFVAAGFAIVWMVDHFVYPICPACAHSHNHDDCGAPLHGFAGPLLAAISIHSFLDGWGLAASQQSTGFVKLAFLLGIGLHKLPEGLALGAIVRASMASHWKAVAGCIAAEAMTLAGGAAGLGIAAGAGASWEGVLLAGAAGIFIYLGYHAIEEEVHRRFAREQVQVSEER